MNSIKGYNQFILENLNFELPTKKISSVFHVGDMNISNKSDFSLEGSGLSVSLHPDAWVKIAKLGGRDIYVLTNNNGIFVDAYKINKKQKDSIISWGINNELVTKIELYKVLFGDGSYMEFDNLDDAEYESDGEYEIKKSKNYGIKATDKLKNKTKQKRIDISSTFDLLLSVYVEDLTLYDGVWWSDKLDIYSLSAPRGVIFNSKIKDWKIKRKD